MSHPGHLCGEWHSSGATWQGVVRSDRIGHFAARWLQYLPRLQQALQSGNLDEQLASDCEHGDEYRFSLLRSWQRETCSRPYWTVLWHWLYRIISIWEWEPHRKLSFLWLVSRSGLWLPIQHSWSLEPQIALRIKWSSRCYGREITRVPPWSESGEYWGERKYDGQCLESKALRLVHSLWERREQYIELNLLQHS